MTTLISPQLTRLNLSSLRAGQWVEVFTSTHQESILMHVYGSGDLPIVDIKRVVHGMVDGPGMILLGSAKQDDDPEHGVLRRGARIVVKAIGKDRPITLAGVISHWKITNHKP